MRLIKVLGYDLTDHITDGVYIHGKLWKNPYSDICELKPIPSESGIYQCEVHLSAEDIKPGVLYFWFNAQGRNRGLIVSPDDEDGNKDATNKFFSGADFL